MEDALQRKFLYKIKHTLVDLITIHISEMTRGDKVTVFLCLVTSCLFASIITVLKKFDNPSVWYIDAIINFFQAIVIAAIFSIIDRIGTLIPVEKRLGEIYQAINKNAELAKQEHINSNKSLVDSIDRLADYSNYQNAKNNYGFNSIQGIELVQDLRIGGISTQSKNLALNIIRNAEFGDKISYMTTFLGEESVYIKSIREAVYRGVKIKLLLMMPSLHAPVIQSRFYDVSDITHRVPRENFAEKDKQIKMFLSLLQAKADIILELRDELQKNSGKNNGSFEVLFYTKSLNFPLIHIERPTIKGDKAYRGVIERAGQTIVSVAKATGEDMDAVGEAATDIAIQAVENLYGTAKNFWKSLSKK